VTDRERDRLWATTGTPGATADLVGVLRMTDAVERATATMRDPFVLRDRPAV
jgi:hypothetical protein